MDNEKSEKYKWIDAVANLIELTRKGELKWAVEENAKTPFDNERITAVFKTRYNDKNLRLYKIKVNYLSTPKLAQLLLESASGFDSRELVFLEIVTEDGFKVWTFPQIYALSNLMDTVEYQVSDASAFLKSINRDTDISASRS